MFITAPELLHNQILIRFDPDFADGLHAQRNFIHAFFLKPAWEAGPVDVWESEQYKNKEGA